MITQAAEALASQKGPPEFAPDSALFSLTIVRDREEHDQEHRFELANSSHGKRLSHRTTFTIPATRHVPPVQSSPTFNRKRPDAG